MQTNRKQNSSKQTTAAQPRTQPQAAPAAELNPFAQGAPAEAAQAPAEQTFPVPVDGQTVELTLDELQS